MKTLCYVIVFCLATNGFACKVSAFQTNSKVQFHVVDKNDAKIPCRIHLKNLKDGSAVKPPRVPFWNDHFVCDGTVDVELPRGEYRWLVERGPEYKRLSGKLNITSKKPITKTIRLERICDLRENDWRSADMHVHRNPRDIELLMKAEDLDFAPVITWWNQPRRGDTSLEKIDFAFDQHRMFELNAGEDEREGGALLFFGLKKPLDLKVDSREFPSPMKFVGEARKQNEKVWIDIEKPFWWDVPLWLSTGRMNSIGIANNHMLHGGMLESEAWGKSRDQNRFPAPRGNGFWTQQIYYNILNAGIRLSPSAGSASGVLKNPVGYNRVYVFDPEQNSTRFSRDRFFEKLQKGNSFVTNGPLLRVFADGKPPGAQFELNSQGERTIELKIELDSNDHVPAIEVIRNGKICKTVICDNYEPDAILRLQNPQRESLKAKIDLDQPGWFLVRAITDKQNTFRFASTAPFYVGNSPVKRDAAQFFLDWTKERIERVKANVRNPEHRKSILVWHEKAKSFWQKKVADSSPADNETFAESKARTLAAIASSAHSFTNFANHNFKTSLKKANQANSETKFFEQLTSLTLASISINPESRVKISSTRDRIKLAANTPKQFLLKVENVAGITAPLRLRAIDLSDPDLKIADWCEIKIVKNPYTSDKLTSKLNEFKIVKVIVKRRGLHEVRIIADAGQGTQDLGFRATMDLMIDTR